MLLAFRHGVSSTNILIDVEIETSRIRLGNFEYIEAAFGIADFCNQHMKYRIEKIGVLRFNRRIIKSRNKLAVQLLRICAGYAKIVYNTNIDE